MDCASSSHCRQRPVEFPRFLGWPELGGAPTYGVLVIYVAVAAIALALLALAALRLVRASIGWLRAPLGDAKRSRFDSNA